MFSRIHEKLGTAGFVVAVVALVAALAGTAFAAAGLNGKQKNEVTKIAKKYAGKRGPAGPAGAAGPQGSPGAKGDIGATGPEGKQGTQGAQGQQGIQGAQGSAGTAGANGKTILSGTTVPANSLGVNGDFYIRTDTSEMYGPKVGGAWGSPTALQGAAGAPGPPGAPGSPWVAGTAPSKVILKGTWAIQQYTAAAAGEKIPTPISVGVPIPTGTLIGFAVGGGLVNESPLAAEMCPGDAATPTINTAFLEGFGVGGVCLYAQEQTNLKEPSFETGDFRLVSSGGGTVALFGSEAAGDASGFGTWVLFTP